jgi:hypothetical protein
MRKTINHYKDKYIPQNKDIEQLIIIIIIIIIGKPDNSVKVLQQCP